MCGIAGLVDYQRPVEPERLGAMLDLMVHRGPDDEGRFDRGPFSVGMRRLSIIDVEGGHQPIANEDETVWVVLNGEIYNYVELKGELRSKGHVFRTETDTEVLVHLYEEYGEAFPEKLNGMFGLAVWDTRNRKVVAARDHLGIKPLYWHYGEGRLVFASELKCILASGIALPELDREALGAYLHLGYIPRDRSPFLGIEKLLPGHRLVFEEGAPPRVEAYWRLAEAFARPADVSLEEAAEEAGFLLRDAVRLQLRSDVPLGTFLSGGIDSSSVTAVAASLLPRLDTFGIGFTDHYFDETPYAREVAGHVGSRHHEEFVDPDALLENLALLTWHMDEPNGDPALLPSYVVSRHARRHVKVALSGNGGDEVFAGYPWHTEPPPMNSMACRVRAWTPRWARRAALWCAGRVRPLPAGTERRLLASNNTIGMGYFASHADPVVRGALTPWVDGVFDEVSWIEKVFAEVPRADGVNQRLYYDATNYMTDQILNMVDRASMAVSLEVRVPLLDKRLVEFMATVPGDVKGRGKTGKAVLRRAMQGQLPDAVFERRKLGFGLPGVRWITSPQIMDVLQTMKDGALAGDGWLDGKAFEGYLAQPARLADHWAYCWNLMTLELWYRQFVKQHGRPRRLDPGKADMTMLPNGIEELVPRERREDPQALAAWLISEGALVQDPVYRYLAYMKVMLEQALAITEVYDLRSGRDRRGHKEHHRHIGPYEMMYMVHQLYVLDSHGVEGGLLECGVSHGYSTCVLSRACAYLGKTLYAADSFEGLPEVRPDEEYFREGDYACSLEQVQRNLAYLGAPGAVEYIQGFYCDSLKGFAEPLCLLWLDVDLFESTRDVLNHAFACLDPRGIIYTHEFTDFHDTPHQRGSKTPPGAIYEHLDQREERVYPDHLMRYFGAFAFETSVARGANRLVPALVEALRTADERSRRYIELREARTTRVAFGVKHALQSLVRGRKEHKPT